MRKEKGITLIALVVTIIILIILAAVSVNLLLGKNGIITKAKEAKQAQKIAEIKERISLEIASAETDAILRNEHLEQAQLEDIVSKYGELQEDGDTIITKEDNYEISLKEIWYGVLSESGSYTDKLKQIEILEKELEELKAKYKELEDLNSGNSEILEELRNQIEALEEEKEVLQNSIANQEKLIKELNDLKDMLAQTNATSDKILKDYKAYSNGELITGTLEILDLESQTQATATASQILDGQTAWVNGVEITGTMVNQGELNWSPTGLESYTVPEGYYSGGTISTENAYNEGVSLETMQSKKVSDASTHSFKISYTGNYLLVIVSPTYANYNLTISGVNSKSLLFSSTGQSNTTGTAIYKISATAGQTLKIKNGRYDEGGSNSGTQHWYLCKY